MDNGYRMYLTAERGLSDGTVATWNIHLAHAERVLGERGKTLGTATPDDLQECLRSHIRAGYSAKTTRGLYSAIRAHLRYQELNGRDVRTALEYLEAPKVPKTLPFPPNEAELAEVLRQINARPHRKHYLRDVALFEVLYAGGLRASEVCGLTVGAFDWTAPSVRVLGKGRKERNVMLTQNAVAAVQAYLFARNPKPSDNVFVTRSGRALGRFSLVKIVRRWGRWAKLKRRLYPHLMRHACATHWLGRMVEQGKGGEALLNVQHHLGHANLTTTERYTHVEPRQLKRWHTRFAPARMA